MQFEKCYKCGQVKLATFNVHTDAHLNLTHDDIEMVKMGWNARGPNGTRVLGKHRCKNCKTATKFPHLVRQQAIKQMVPEGNMGKVFNEQFFKILSEA